MVFAFLPIQGCNAVQDSATEPPFHDKLCNPFPTSSYVRDHFANKDIHFKVGGGQHGCEATKQALQEKPYLLPTRLSFFNAEVYAMGYLVEYLKQKVCF